MLLFRKVHFVGFSTQLLLNSNFSDWSCGIEGKASLPLTPISHIDSSSPHCHVSDSVPGYWPGKGAEAGPCVLALACLMETQKKLLAANWPSPDYCDNKQMVEIFLCLFFYLCSSFI